MDIVVNDNDRENVSVSSAILSFIISMPILWLVPGILPSMNCSSGCVRVKSTFSKGEDIQEVL